MNKKQGYLCSKCLKIYKTKKEALICESNCLNKEKAQMIYNIFLKYYNIYLKGVKGVTGYKSVRYQIIDRLNEAETILKIKKTEDEK